MFPTLFAKLAAALVGLGVILSITLAILLESSHDRFHLEVHQQLFEPLAAQLLAEAQAEGAIQPDLDALLNRVRQLAILNPKIAAFLLDANGKVLRSSRPAEELRRSTVRIEPIIQFISGPEKWPLLGEDPLSESGRTIFSAAAVEPPTQGAGFLYVVVDSPYEEKSALFPTERSYSLEDALWLTLGNIAAGLVAALVVIRIITKPVTRLRRTMEAFDRSQFTASVRYRADRPRWLRDEIDRLGEIFDAMAERIAAQIEALRRTDEVRRELFANISHDLRTPLTAVRGYVHTLLTKQGLPDAERRRFLEIVQRQTAQLSRLVEQVMELARLDAPMMQLDLEEFALDELAFEAIADMRPLLEQKGIKADVTRGRSTIRISADAALVRRALKNIVDNAIRVSPHGSTMEMSIDAGSTYAEICVSDQGPGIPVDEIEHIFRRFYRGAEQVETPSNGAGVGLAIVRRIVELHGGNVSVENRPQGGATFRLRLPLSAPSS